MGQDTTGRSPLSQPPKPLMALRSSNVFSHFQPGVYHTKHNIHNREGGRKENKYELGLSPSARREKFVTNFV